MKTLGLACLTLVGVALLPSSASAGHYDHGHSHGHHGGHHDNSSFSFSFGFGGGGYSDYSYANFGYSQVSGHY